MFVWTFDGVVSAFMISLGLICGLVFAASVLVMKITEWWKRRK